MLVRFASAAMVLLFASASDVMGAPCNGNLTPHQAKLCTQKAKAARGPARVPRAPLNAEDVRRLKLLTDPPHRPIPARDSDEAKHEEAQEKKREEEINRIVKFGICRGC